MNKKESTNKNAAQHSSSEDIIGLTVHAYNNFLSGIMGFTELALLDCQQETVKSQLDASLESSNQAVHFGKQLLSSVARLQVGLKLYDLDTLLTKINKPNRDLVLMDKECGSLLIKTNEEWFLYCINLLIQFCDDFSGNIESQVEVSTQANNIKIIVFNKGLVLNNEQQKKLFNPFFSSRELLGSKDVGLAVVKGFLTQMSGSIHFQNDQKFVLKIPYAKEA
ncbi:ATP-binding protein [Aliikangiella sp. IMCC44359]|uniref:ATP-binding protein n=1 Tax=Aliikangiella sp. IMCC44359 TaxID=3459125 RepID=UPI00403AB37B